jgi:dTDP-glucose 4,6-dehydratase
LCYRFQEKRKPYEVKGGKVKRILITGGAGFVGHHTVEWYLDKTTWEIVTLDSFRHAGDSLRVIASPRHEAYVHDLNAPISHRLNRLIGPVDYILNLSSCSDVDLSITDPLFVWENNTRLIGNILDYAKSQPSLEAFIQCSTDEVFGPAPDGYFHKEWETHMPSNPYSASKAAQESLCVAFWRTYGVPVIITNTMNMIGERQEPTKYLPKVIKGLFTNMEIIIHGSPAHIGSRMYLDAKNLADAWLYLLKNYVPVKYDSTQDAQRPSRFNIVGQEEISNLDLVLRIGKLMGNDNPKYKFVDFHATRPGHDRRYALDGSKIAKLGWKHPIPIDDTLKRIVDFYVKECRKFLS